MKFLYIISFILLSLIFLFFGCRKTLESRKVVKNNSSQIIKILRYSVIDPLKTPETFLINSNSEATIVFGTSHGAFYTLESGCARKDIDSLVITVYNNPNVIISKDLSKDYNWTFSKSGGNIECRATIIDSDIVPK